ncbi:MAG: hypothetical protein J6S67_06295 [Methanobrevibacter sp.]|nr:hypothetical protein [Methanobrevibacter sp.]
MIKFNLVEITPEKADEWLQKRNTENYRNYKPSAEYLYKKDMKDGNWLFNGDTIKFDTNGNLIDGQHRLKAIKESETTQKYIVVEGLDPECTKTIDIGFKRSVEDYLRKFAKMYEKGATAVVKQAMTLARGNDQIGHSAANQRISNAMVIDTYNADESHFNEAAVFCREISKQSKKVLKPAHVGGIYYHLVYTLGIDVGKVREFFDRLSSYSTVGKNDYFTKTYEILEDKKGKLGRSGADIIRAYRRCWNTFVNGNTKNLIDEDKNPSEFMTFSNKKVKVTSTVFAI